MIFFKIPVPYLNVAGTSSNASIGRNGNVLASWILKLVDDWG